MYGYYKLVIWVADITLYFQDSCLAAVRAFPSGGVEGIAVIFMLAEQADAAVLEKESKKTTYVWDSKDIKVSFQIKNLPFFFLRLVYLKLQPLSSWYTQARLVLGMLGHLFISGVGLQVQYSCWPYL